MFRILPDDPRHLMPVRPPDEMRRRALELVLLELKHQPVLKAHYFGSGFAAGLAVGLAVAVVFTVLPI